MNDPADDQTEDVVSSIRRLVSRDAAGPDRQDKLVLGPALRVAAPKVAGVAAAGQGNRRVSATAGARQEASRAAALAQPADDAALLEQRIAELEAAVAAKDEIWEAEGSGILGRATARNPVRTARADGTERGPALGPPGAPATAAKEVDEAALRALVAEIVREELQGALGERITRNIRKLVRREINRALAVRDSE